MNTFRLIKSITKLATSSLGRVTLFVGLALITSIFPSFSQASTQSWAYKKFPFVRPTSDDRLPAELSAGRDKLRALMPRGSGTHPLLGIEQYFATRNFEKFIFVKRGVELTESFPIGGWVRLGNGFVLHLKDRGSVTAFYTEGFSSSERIELDKQLRASGKVASIVELMLPRARASGEVTSGGKGPRSRHGRSPPVSTTDASKVTEGGTTESDGFVQCLAEQTYEGLKDTASQGWEMAQSGWEVAKDTYNDPRGAASSVMRYAKDGANAAYDAGKTLVTDPQAVYDGVKAAAAKVREVIAHLYASVKSVVANLDPDVAKEVMCNMIGEFAASGLFAVALSSTGVGAVMGTAKVVAFTKKFVDKLQKLKPTLEALSAAKSMNPAQKQALVRDVLRGKKSPEAAQTEIARLRGQSSSDKKEMLASAGKMSPEQRRAAAQDAIRDVSQRELTDAQLAAIDEAHKVGGARPNFDYSQKELAEKARILKDAGFSADERQVLMRKGITGGDDWGEEIRFGSSGAASGTGSIHRPYEAERALRWERNTPAAGDAKRYYVSEGRRLVGNQTGTAREYFIIGGDIGEYAATIRSKSTAQAEMVRIRKAVEKLERERDVSREKISNKPDDLFYQERIGFYNKALEHLDEALRSGFFD